MKDLGYEARAEKVMPKWSSWGGGIVEIKKKYWYESRYRIISILKQLHRAKKQARRITELEDERTRYKNCLEFLVVSHANGRVKMECVNRALEGK